MPIRILLVCLLLLTACRRVPESKVVRLVDLFDSAKVEGSPSKKAAEPAALWDFSKPLKPGGDATLGWKAGDGVTGLKLVDGKLTGKSTTDFPIIYVVRPKTVDQNDAFDSVQIRIRVNGGGAVAAAGDRGKLDFPKIIGRGRGFPWPFQSPVTKGSDFQTLTLPAKQIARMSWDSLLIRPADAPGVTFEIESLQAISQRERRASVRSGVGWQGLADVYQEALVSRSPEKIQMDVDVPANAWLDLNLGTVEDAPVTFKIAAVDGGKEEVLLERTVTTPHRWEPVPVDLSGQSGRKTLRFWLDISDERHVGFWGSPVIRVHGAQPQGKPANALGSPNPPQGVILIMCDTLRKDHLTMYGHKRDTSPILANLASQGTLFLDNVTQATWTKVSTPSIMTGMYPKSHRVHDFQDRVSAAADTLAESYRAAGYATVSYSSVLFTGKFTNLQQGFEELHESTSVDDPKYEAKTARTYVDRAIGWIGRHRDNPFFMYLHVLDPHDPFEPRAPYDALWADPAKKEEHEAQLNKIRKEIQNPLLKAFGMPTKTEIEKAGVSSTEFVGHDKNWYDGSIRGMDAEIGRLVERLAQLGLDGKVQIAFISDHGEEFIEHGRMFHGQSVYGELTGVPMVLYRPGVIPAGVQIKETVRNIDLMPTLLDLSGLPVPKKVQGQSLVPLIAAMRESKGAVAGVAQTLGWKPEPAVTEKAKTENAGGPPPYETESYGIVHDGWKLVHHVQRAAGEEEFKLFNHVEDPLDSKNVAAEHPDQVTRLKALLADWNKMVEKGKLPKGDSAEGLSSKELERLKSLGYVQ